MTGKIWMKPIGLLTVMFTWFPNCINVNLVALVIVIWLCKMLIFGDLGEDYMGILCYFYNVLLALTLLQNKKFKIDIHICNLILWSSLLADSSAICEARNFSSHWSFSDCLRTSYSTLIFSKSANLFSSSSLKQHRWQLCYQNYNKDNMTTKCVHLYKTI